MEDKEFGKRSRLADIISYEPEKYLQDDEIALIKATFKNNHTLLRIIRKIMLPTISDPAMPIENFGIDVYMLGRNWDQIPTEEVKALVVARQEAVKFIMGGLIQLKTIANTKDETPDEKAARLRKDSSQ